MTRQAMTREQWDRLFRLHYSEQRKRHPTMDLERARSVIYDSMVASFGPRPAGPPKPPLPARVGLWALTKKLRGLAPVEVFMSPFVKKLVVSMIYAVGASAATVQLALADAVISGDEWAAIMSAFVAAFWGTFKSNTTVIEPSRAGETIAGPPKA